MDGSGFRAVQPETRADRMSKGDKAALEKQRLEQRRGGFYKYEDPGAVTEQTPGTLGYSSERERYQTGAAAELKRNREEVVRAREERYDFKREQLLHREDERWRKAEEQHLQSHLKQEFAALGSKGSHNHSSVAYNPVNAEYHATAEGARQKYEDELAKYRGAVRTEKLHRYASGDGFNPITGQQLASPAVPNKPHHVPLAPQPPSTRPW